MKYMVLSLLFIAGSSISYKVAQIEHDWLPEEKKQSYNNEDYQQRLQAAQKASDFRKNLKQYKSICIYYGDKIRILRAKSKITADEERKISHTLTKYKNLVDTKIFANNFDKKILKISTAMLELRVKAILNGTRIEKYKVSSFAKKRSRQRKI